MFITGAAEEGAHADVHTLKSDRGLVLGAPNVDLMMGLYEVERSAGNEGGKGRKERRKEGQRLSEMNCGGDGVFLSQVSVI